MRLKELILLGITLFLISFGLNFIWESYHSVLFYNCCENMNSPTYLRLISHVSIIDAGMILLAYFLVGLKSGLIWIRDKKIGNYIGFSVIALILAIWIEYRGVYLLEKWSYNEWMPVIFGLGLSPLIQLIVTGICGLLLTKRILYK
ncbi:MAG: hypothetical protein Q7S27_00505 [Nanoarchaeota archaeon]|nr:hypothetical protein [Nanoarchaeota archaeon]